MTTWKEIFDPVTTHSTRKLEPRPQQEQLGQAIIDTFEEGTNLAAQALVGTGKSFAVLVPMINKILASKADPKSNGLRGVVSTETLSLQDQYAFTDLPFLSKVYPGFTFKTLKGRSNYICFNLAKQNARGNSKIATLVTKLNPHRTRLGLGERRDVDRVLGKELDDSTWAFIAGSSAHCGENQCTKDECYSTKARAEALEADIVIVNHALLRVDADTREDGLAEDTFLGQVDLLCVDEAHTLEQVLIDGWTEELSEWELLDKTTKISTASEESVQLINNPTLGFRIQNANDAVSGYLKSVVKFFGLIHKDDEWKNVSETISLKYITGSVTPPMFTAMNEYENSVEDLEEAIKTYESAVTYFKSVKEKMMDEKIKGTRKVTKGMTAARDLIKILKKINQAMETKGGTIVEYGVPYVVTASGIEKRNGDRSVRLKVVPLDISEKAKNIWHARSSVLMSGTLADLTDGSFRYATTSLGFPDHQEVSTDSVFDHNTQQLVYVTPGLQETIDLKGAQFSMIELLDLITAARGRTLVLFTSRAELDFAGEHVRQLVAAGEFPWRVLIQDKDSNKATLKEQFEKDTHSVLFATKSFFTGNDFPGETLSLVAICKFPLPQFNVVCRQQIDWWRRRGFPNWYEREALAVFHQAAGRLIRSSGDTGVIALLDQRAARSNERVCQTALTGVKGLGSPVTQNLEVVKKFLS